MSRARKAVVSYGSPRPLSAACEGNTRYIRSMLPLVRKYPRFFLGACLAALVLRLFFVFKFPAVVDDSHFYANIAENWLQHGVYGMFS